MKNVYKTKLRLRRNMLHISWGQKLELISVLVISELCTIWNIDKKC